MGHVLQHSMTEKDAWQIEKLVWEAYVVLQIQLASSTKSAFP